jgi:polysaccharide biosynthesis protein PslH
VEFVLSHGFVEEADCELSRLDLKRIEDMNVRAASGDQPRVLYLTKVYPYPPATAGDAVYSRGVIEAFSRTCRLTVICSDSGASRDDTLPIDWHVVGPQRTGRAGSILSRWPLIAWKGATPDYTAKLDLLLREKWDAIVLDNLGSAHALTKAKRYRDQHPGVRLVYISHEYEYPTRGAKYGAYDLGLLKRRAAQMDLEKVRASEEALLRDCDIVTVINKADLEPFRKIAPGAKYLPLIPGYDGPVVAAREITDATPRRILLLGGRRSEQKRQILLDWMEASYARLLEAGIETVIVGDMDEGLRERLVTLYPAARVLGFVDDLAALVASARMGVVADTVGGGFKMRLLSHVFERLPIVGLTGAVSGLPTPQGAGWLGADTLLELVDLVREVIDDTERLNGLQNKAFADSASAFSWAGRADDLALALGARANEVLV